MCMREIGSMNYGMIYFRNRKIRKIFYSLRMLIKYIQSIQYIYIKVSLDYLPKKNRFEKKRRRKGERDKMFFSLSDSREQK